MATTIDSGTQSCTVTTEHSLEVSTTAGVFVASFNLVNAVNGDAFRIRVYNKTLTGDGTTDTLFDCMYANDQGVNNNIITPPWVSMFRTEISITQTTGTSRNVPWALIQVDA